MWFMGADLVQAVIQPCSSFNSIQRKFRQTSSQTLESVHLKLWWTHDAAPANTIRWPNVGSKLGRRRRRWANIEPTLGQRIVFAGHAPAIMYLFI